MNNKRIPLYLRFWSKVKVTDGCWEWTGGSDSHGYGQIWVYEEGHSRRATRVMWFLRYGSWPTLDILHSCDNPPCVNPAHLSEGTMKENIRQCVERGRHAQAKKTKCRNGHSLTKENTTRCGHRRYCKVCQRNQWAKRYPDAKPRGTKGTDHALAQTKCLDLPSLKSEVRCRCGWKAIVIGSKYLAREKHQQHKAAALASVHTKEKLT